MTALAGCSRVTYVTSYYLLDYHPYAKNPALRLEKPLPHKAQVLTFKIPRSFDSIRIIARFSAHQINYYRYSLWGVRPQLAVADLLVQHLNAYQLFQKCQREYLDERPNYEITGEIFQIERYESEKYSAAHLKMSFEMFDYEDRRLLVRYNIDRETQIPPGDMTIFAKTISDFIQEEAEKFMVKMVEYFDRLEADTSGGD